jgi:flagellar FliJ protein
MGKFKFRFDSIIRIKEILEKRIQEEIAVIDREIVDLKNQLKIIFDERMRIQKNMLERPLKAVEFQSAKMYDSILEKQIQAVQKKIKLVVKKRQEKQNELVEKRKEQKVFETLKENQLQEFNIEDRRMELKETNEIGIRNYHGHQE